MSLQKIKSLTGKEEYVLLPITVYKALKVQIDNKISHVKRKTINDDEFVPFELEDYVDNPVALARMKSHLTQAQLAERMEVSQAYVSKIERQDNVTAKLLARVKKALKKACGNRHTPKNLGMRKIAP